MTTRPTVTYPASAPKTPTLDNFWYVVGQGERFERVSNGGIGWTDWAVHAFKTQKQIDGNPIASLANGAEMLASVEQSDVDAIVAWQGDIFDCARFTGATMPTEEQIIVYRAKKYATPLPVPATPNPVPQTDLEFQLGTEPKPSGVTTWDPKTAQPVVLQPIVPGTVVTPEQHDHASGVLAQAGHAAGIIVSTATDPKTIETASNIISLIAQVMALFGHKR